jgi:hypothetical protein
MRAKGVASALVLLIATLPFAVHAEGPGYTHLDAGYLRLKVDDFGSLSGWGIDGSAAITDRFHLFGGYARAEKGGATATVAGAGLGFNTPIAPNTDFVARAGLARAEVKARVWGYSFSESENGPIAAVGVRSKLLSTLELNGFLHYSDVGDSETSVSVGGLFDVYGPLSLLGNVDRSSDVTTYTLGLRVSF